MTSFRKQYLCATAEEIDSQCELSFPPSTGNEPLITFNISGVTSGEERRSSAMYMNSYSFSFHCRSRLLPNRMWTTGNNIVQGKRFENVFQGGSKSGSTLKINKYLFSFLLFPMNELRGICALRLGASLK